MADLTESDAAKVTFRPHEPIPTKLVAAKHYRSQQRDVKFINKDGTILQFHHHMFVTEQSAHQNYLDEEIERYGNPAVRYATEDEIRQHNMSIDPKGTVTKELVNDPDFMAQLRWELENKVRREHGLEELPNPFETGETQAGEEVGQGKSIKTETGKVTLETLKTQALTPQSPPRLTPAGTDKMASGGAAESNSPGTA